MQKDMDDAIEHLETQLEDLHSKFGSIPLRPASEMPLDRDSMHDDSVLSLATPPQRPKSESPEVCWHHGGNLFADPMVHIVTPPILSSVAPSSIPFVGQSARSETLGNYAPLPSPDLSYLPSFGSLPHQSPLDPLPATPPLRLLGFGGLGGSGEPSGSGVPGGPGAIWGPQGPPYALGFYRAAVTPPNPIPKIKMDALDKFDGRPTKVKPSVWLTKVERWLRLCQIPWEAMVDSTVSRLTGGALTWVNSRIADAERRYQQAFRNWQEFRDAFLRQFEPLSAQETTRMQIRSHVQIGSVQAYVYKFRELMANIPSMNMDEAYHLFISGLQPHLWQLVGTLVPKNDLEAAIDMAQKSIAYGGAQIGRQEIGEGRG